MTKATPVALSRTLASSQGGFCPFSRWSPLISETPITQHRVRIGDGVMAYTLAGSGEPLLLVHGLGSTRQTWNPILAGLAETYTVIAPDLPGHGESDAPAGDYSLGALAAALRDLLVVLGLPSATVVGHSLGGGIALQFGYQFPERTDRLVLISSGGLGRQLTPALRAATLPGSRTVVAAMARTPRGVSRRMFSLITATMPGLLARSDAEPVAEQLYRLRQAGQRQTFVRTARTVINWRGQSVSATQHLRPLADLPIMLIWGADDRTIPPHHHRTVARMLTDPHLLEIPGAGHFPHETAPETVLPELLRFLDSTPPFRYAENRWRELLRAAA